VTKKYLSTEEQELERESLHSHKTERTGTANRPVTLETKVQRREPQITEWLARK